jgi:hypothetical protein
MAESGFSFRGSKLARQLANFRDALLESTGLTPVAKVGRLAPHMQIYVHPVLPPRSPSALVNVVETANEIRRRLQDWLAKPTLSDLLPNINFSLLDIFRTKSGHNPSIIVVEDKISQQRAPASSIARELSDRLDKAAARNPAQDETRLALIRSLNRSKSAQDNSPDFAALEGYVNSATVDVRPKSIFGKPVEWSMAARSDMIAISSERNTRKAEISLGSGFLSMPGPDGEERSFIGLRAMKLGNDASKNRQAIQKTRENLASALGLPIEKISLVHHPDLLPGTSVLLNCENLVPAKKINPSWDSASLAKKFGISFSQFHKERADRSKPKNVLPPELLARIGGDPDKIFDGNATLPKLDMDRGPGAGTAVVVLRERAMDLVNHQTGNSIPCLDFRDLEHGDYRIYGADDMGNPVGVLRVNELGATQMIYHANANGFRDLLEHNFRMSRPSFEPANTSDAAPRYAHLGEVMKKSDVLVARAEERARRGADVPSVDFFSAPDLREGPKAPPQVPTSPEGNFTQPVSSEGRGQNL